MIRQRSPTEGEPDRIVEKIESFSALKRYKDFDALRSTLVERWPGFFIPGIPPTKVIVSVHIKKT